MGLSFWNRRRREAAEEGELRDAEVVSEAAEATAGQGGTEGAEGHTGTDVTTPPLGGPDSTGIDTHGETHEDAAQEAVGDAQGPETQENGQEAAGDAGTGSEGENPTGDENGGESGAEGSDEGAGEGDTLPKPSNGASKADWTAWALDPKGGAKSEEDLAGLGRDGIRDLFA